jgi:hypothetical protein
MAMRVSMMICAVGDHQLRQMKKKLSVCTMLCKVMDERVLKAYQQKKEYQLKLFTAFFKRI